MRELIYLSERKLAQFREDGSRRRRRWRRRVDELGATAPLGLGEMQVTLGDAPQQGPSLDRVLRYLDGVTPKPGAYTDVPPDAGRWVRFTTRVNYEVVRPTEDAWNGDRRPVERAVGPPAVIFWEPQAPWTPWDRPTPRLVLHGSPEHLLGLGARPPEPTDLSVSRSTPPGFMDLLYGSSPRNGEHPGGALGNLLHQLDKRFPPEAAGLVTGYARVTFGLEVPFSVGGHSARVRTVVASPLYVERAAA